MKYSTIILALAATISAQSIADLEATIPQCAQTCLLAAVASSGCSASDFVCQCGSGMAAIRSSATTCITGALGTATGCTIAEALTVQPITDQVCALIAAAPASSAAPAPSSPAPTLSSAAAASPSIAVADPRTSTVFPVTSPVAPATSAGSTSAGSMMPPTNGTYSTVYTTKVYTVTSCAATVTSCPAGKVTTEIVSLYTTFCPYSTTYALVPLPSTYVTVPGPKPTTMATGSSNGTVIKGTATVTSPPVQVTGAACGLEVGGFLGAAAALAVLVL